MKLWQELRRRRVFRVMGVYVVGAWVILQVAATLFPAWGIPDEGLRYLFLAAVIGFPIASVFGWFFDVTVQGIVRTPPAHETELGDYRLKRTDYAILAALVVVALAVLYGSFERVVETTAEDIAARVKLPDSVAVIPFENLDDESDSDYFSDGITEEILHRLSEFDGIRVLGQASSFAFKDSDAGPTRISDILGVRYLLLGSIRRDGEQVRVRASLVDERGVQVWSASYDRELQGIFAVQSDIANLVARQMVAEIAPRDMRSGNTTQDPEAHRLYLVGRDYLRSRVPNYKKGAIDAFRQAIELDDRFAPAHAGLAITLALRAADNVRQFGDNLDEAQSHATTALQLVPDLAEGHAAQGLILQMGQQADYVAAEEALRRAFELDPTLIDAYNWLSGALGQQGKIRESRAVQREALEIDPLNPILNVNVARQFASTGDFRAAERHLLRLMEMPSPSAVAYREISVLYNHYGRFPKCIEWAKKRIVAHGFKGDGWPVSDLAHFYLHVGMPTEADYWIEKSMEFDSDPLNEFFRRAYRLKVNGRYDAMQALLNDVLEKYSVDVSRLTLFAAEIIGAVYVMNGDYERGIPLLESVFEPVTSRGDDEGATTIGIDFMQLLAYAYRSVGRDEDAKALLEKTQDEIEFLELARDAGSPGHLERKTLQHVMRDETAAAVRTFEQAVDTGWRNFYFIEHDPRWTEFFALPAVQSQLAFVRADLERQRKLVEAADAAEDFRATIETELAGR